MSTSVRNVSVTDQLFLRMATYQAMNQLRLCKIFCYFLRCALFLAKLFCASFANVVGMHLCPS